MTGTALGKQIEGNVVMTFYPVPPCPKPRMTRSDKWKKRDCVMRYWAFKDEINAYGVKLPDSCCVVFHLPMPKSWSATRKFAMIGKPHQQKPDLDNLIKALCDALLEKDEVLWNINAKKIWSPNPGIEIQTGALCK